MHVDLPRLGFLMIVSIIYADSTLSLLPQDKAGRVAPLISTITARLGQELSQL